MISPLSGSTGHGIGSPASVHSSADSGGALATSRRTELTPVPPSATRAVNETLAADRSGNALSSARKGGDVSASITMIG